MNENLLFELIDFDFIFLALLAGIYRIIKLLINLVDAERFQSL